MSLKLRDYQIEAVEALWAELLHSPTALMVMPPGCGKTEVLQGFVQKAISLKPDFKCAFIVNRYELMTQTAARFKRGLPYVSVGVYRSRFASTKAQVMVATIQSLRTLTPHLHVLLVDETHNLNDASGQYKNFIERCLEVNPKLKIVAVTATPYRYSGYIYGHDKLFKRVCFQRDLKWAQDNGWLVPVKLKHSPHQFDTSTLQVRMGDYIQTQVDRLTMDERKMIEQIKDAMPQLEGRKKIVWACSSIQHAESIRIKLKALGERVSIVHSKQDQARRDSEMTEFKIGLARHLVFVSVVSEGFDHAPIDAVVFMRPTRSPVLYVQIIGRALRPHPDKKEALALDYGGVVENLGPLHDPYVRKGRGDKKTLQVPMKFCPACLHYCEAALKKCPECSHVFAVNSSDDKLKNLSEQSYKGTELAERELEAYMIRVKDNHVSSSGNKCLVIEYYVRSLIPNKVVEYFPENQAWAKNNYWKRLRSLGIGALTGGTELPVNATLTVYKEKGYYKIKNVEAIQ
jgi:DNA repair protein RadD